MVVNFVVNFRYEVCFVGLVVNFFLFVKEDEELYVEIKKLCSFVDGFYLKYWEFLVEFGICYDF